MLAGDNRLRRSEDFKRAMREGKRAVSANLVMHQVLMTNSTPPRVGFIVPKRFVKKASARNLIKRRLRHLVREMLPDFPAGSLSVFSLRNDAQQLSFGQLRDQVMRLLEKMEKKQQHV